MNPEVTVQINIRWLHRRLERQQRRMLTPSFVLDVWRETVHSLEQTLTSGGSISVSQAISEALDSLGYMDVEMPSTS